MAGARPPVLSGSYDLSPLGFVDHPDSEFFRLLQLRACPRARNHEVRLGAHGTSRARAETFGLRLGFVAAHGFEAAGEDDCLAAPLGPFGVADVRLWRDLREQIVERLPVMRLMEE